MPTDMVALGVGRDNEPTPFFALVAMGTGGDEADLEQASPTAALTSLAPSRSPAITAVNVSAAALQGKPSIHGMALESLATCSMASCPWTTLAVCGFILICLLLGLSLWYRTPALKGDGSKGKLSSQDAAFGHPERAEKRHDTWLVACVVTSTLAFNLSLTFLAPFLPALALLHGDDAMKSWLNMVIFIAEPAASLAIGLSCATWLLLRFSPFAIVIVSAMMLFVSLSAGTLLSLTTGSLAFATLAIGIRLVSGIGCSLGQMAGTCLLLQNLPDNTLPDAIGLNEAAVGIAYVAGPLIGGSYDSVSTSSNVPCWPFLIVGSISAIAGCSFICLPRSAISMVVTGATPVSPLQLMSVRGVARGVVLIAYSVVQATCLEPQLELWLNAPPFRLSNLMVGAILACGLLGYAPAAVFARRIQDTVGLEWTLASGCLANFIGLTLLAVAAPLATAQHSVGTVAVFAGCVISSAGSGLLMSSAITMMNTAAKDSQVADPDIPVAVLTIVAAAIGALLGFSSTSLANLLPDAGMQSLFVYAGFALLMASLCLSPCTRCTVQHGTCDARTT